MLRGLRAFITLFLLLLSINGSAQSVGLVLSGGGAKGLYHIGVIEALEENGIPIDYVAGTSMGSIVAGLYAAGYSPAQMREIVTSGEIESWISGRIDSKYGAYYRQYRTIPSLFSLRLDTQSFEALSEEVTQNFSAGEKGKGTDTTPGILAVKPSLYLPNSIISSTQIDLTLSRLFGATSASVNGKFDRLMVPFLCVASDMRNHQAVTLTSGDLGESIRASMAIPIAFNPVKRDSMLLFDGGIYDNYPWRPLLERHSPDIMIGSICTGGNTELTEQSSLIDQVFAISTQKSDYSMPEGNLTIQRDVPVGMLNFSNGGWIIDQGYQDTMEQMEQIKERITTRRDSTYYDDRRAQFNSKIPPLVFENYKVEGLSEEQSLYVRDFLHTSERNRNVLQREMTFEELQENLFSMLSNGDFTTGYPSIEYNQYSERYKFLIELETKPQLKLSMGGHLSSTAFNQILLSLNYKQVRRVAQSYYTDLYLGTVSTSFMFGGRTDFYIKRPLFMDYYFAYSNVNLEYNNLGNLTDVTNTESAKTRDSHFSVAGGFPISRRSLFSLRVNGGWSHYYYDTDTAATISSDQLEETLLYDRTRLGFVAAKAEYQRNTLDRLTYPQSGSNLEVSLINVLGRERNYQSDYNRYTTVPTTKHSWFGGRIKYDKYFTPPGDSWFSLGLNVDAVYTNLMQFGNPMASLMMMPAYQPVIHSKMVFMPDFSGDKYVGAGIVPVFSVANNMLLRTGFYSMYRNKYEVYGVEAGVIGSDQLHHICEATLVYHSTLGALSLSLTKYDIKDWDNLYLTFGFGVPLFSPKGTYY